MTSRTTSRTAVGQRIFHALRKLTLVRILVTSRAGAVFETIGHRRGSAATATQAMALAAGHGLVRSC